MLDFWVPDDKVLAPLFQSFPCRERQIRSLATLLHPSAAPCRNLVVHGAEATGKSAITAAVLSRLSTVHALPAPPPTQTSEDEGRPHVGDARRTGILRYAIVSSQRCITARHLYETIVTSVADALRGDEDSAAAAAAAKLKRCETPAQLNVELGNMLHRRLPSTSGRGHTKDEQSVRRFVLVLDAVDKQRDAPPTLLPALARLSEVMPSLTCVFIVTAPPAGALRAPSSAHLQFSPYSKQDFVRILSLSPPPSSSEPIAAGASPGSDPDTEMTTTTTAAEARLPASATADLWPRFCAAVHDALARPACRTLPALQQGCFTLWPRFIAPVLAGTHTPKEFTKLLIAARTHFQDETLLNPSIVTVKAPPSTAEGGGRATPSPAPPSDSGRRAAAPAALSSASDSTTANATTTANPSRPADLATLLPTTARLLLLCAYLASHNAQRHDLTLFSTYHHSRRRRRGGGGPGSSSARHKHRKIARKLLGAHAFVLERMLAIFAAVRTEWLDGYRLSTAAMWTNGPPAAGGLDGDVGLAMATLASLRLLTRVGGGAGGGGGDVMDRGGKWRINVGWEVVRGLGRSLGVEVEEWLIE